NGYLGHHLTTFARMRGLEVTGIVRSTKALRVVLEAGAQPEVVAHFDPLSLARACAGAAAIVHLAGISAERHGATYEDVNVKGMQNVIEAARTANVRRVIFLSGLGVARYGSSPRSTNAYFLAKLAAEVDLFRSKLEAVVFRPSYIVGPGDELIPALLHEFASGTIEIVGDGSYELQPVAVKDAVEAILVAAQRPITHPTVIDLVGPQPLGYRQFVERVAAVARGKGHPADFKIHNISIEEADKQARAGGYRGLLPDELDVLLSDETASSEPLRAFLGRPLTPIDVALQNAIAGSSARPSGSFRRHV
ncbi:MAG: NAD-dependent epimerase/dehydratase family protein, partial [Vicinamibacteria bacterium]|nr:NAD-dependent epimerase/dehydratase family protein [Vicinamibacteria bacterium]